MGAAGPQRPDLDPTGGGAHMSTYKVGYFVGSLASDSINRTLSKALILFR